MSRLPLSVEYDNMYLWEEEERLATYSSFSLIAVAYVIRENWPA